MSTAPPGVRPCNKRPAVRPFNSQGAARFISQNGGGVAVDLKADADLDDFRCLPSQEDPSLYVFHPEIPVVVTMTKGGVRVNGLKVVGSVSPRHCGRSKTRSMNAASTRAGPGDEFPENPEIGRLFLGGRYQGSLVAAEI